MLYWLFVGPDMSMIADANGIKINIKINIIPLFIHENMVAGYIKFAVIGKYI